MTPDEVATGLGACSWSDLLRMLHDGGRLVAPRGSLRVLGGAWDALRVQSDLVQVRRGPDVVIGCRCSFTLEELAPDLLVDGLDNTYDDPALPIACPRSNAKLKRLSANSRKAMEDLRSGERQLATLIAIGGGSLLVLSAQLAAVPGVSLLMLVLGLWTSGMAWLMLGDVAHEETGHQPWWSMRRTGIGKWISLNWFGPDRK